MAKFALILSKMFEATEGKVSIESDSHYLNKFKEGGYIKLEKKDALNEIELTQKGREFLRVATTEVKWMHPLNIKALLEIYAETTRFPIGDDVPIYRELHKKGYIYPITENQTGRYTTAGKGKDSASAISSYVKLKLPEDK